MGKGDRKSKKGKLFKGTHGVSRPKKKNKKNVASDVKKVEKPKKKATTKKKSPSTKKKTKAKK